MVHRDPETGQFTGDLHGMHSFDDYEFEHVLSRYDVDAEDLPGAFPIQQSDIRTIRLDDLLDRDERADLVAVQVHGLQASVPGTSSAESSLFTRYEIRAGAGDELISLEDENFTDDGAGVVDTAYHGTDSRDVLFAAAWIAEGGYADSSNSIGAGPDQPVLQAERHYPRELGSCPVFDDRDEITESIYLDDVGSADISDSLIRVTSSYTLVFGIHDRDD